MIRCRRGTRRADKSGPRMTRLGDRPDDANGRPGTGTYSIRPPKSRGRGESAHTRPRGLRLRLAEISSAVPCSFLVEVARVEKIADELVYIIVKRFLKLKISLV